jgi:hypothetical protein
VRRSDDRIAGGVTCVGPRFLPITDPSTFSCLRDPTALPAGSQRITDLPKVT